MIILEMATEPCDTKQQGHTRGEDYAVCNGNPNKFKTTPRKEYEAQEVGMNYQSGLTGRQPI